MAHTFARAQEPTRSPSPYPSTAAPLGDGKSVAEWIERWSAQPAMYDRDVIASRLAKAGAPIVPDLRAQLDANGPGTALAIQALELMGDAAAPALPKLAEILRTRGYPDATGRVDTMPTRERAFWNVKSMSWAAATLVPVLVAVADDPQETDWFRGNAVRSLGSMGEPGLAEIARIVRRDRAGGAVRSIAISQLEHSGKLGIDVLEGVVADPRDPCHDNAERVLADLYQESGVQTREGYYAKLIEADPFSDEVLGWLVQARGAWHLDRPHALTERVKSLWRARLAEKPDPRLALDLARLIQDELRFSELEWETGHQYLRKESPVENYATLAEALEIGRRSCDGTGAPWYTLTVSLAKVKLLQGDWDGLNALLAELGEPPIESEARRWLAPPPPDWHDLHRTWVACDEPLRSGDCAFEVRVEKDGRGLRGAQVVVRKQRQSNLMSTGVSLDTLSYDTDPICRTAGRHVGGFGWADDRTRTSVRYAVTDERGIARFEQLPAMSVEMEVLIPTANFPEPGTHWDLWVKQADGSLALNHYRWREGFALESGKTVQAPLLVVKPRFAMQLEAGQALDPANFELAWSEAPHADGAPPVRYEVELAVGFPQPMALRDDDGQTLASARAVTTGRSLPIGANGVDGLRLAPGNVYLLQVTARDEADRLLARSARTWCYVPWTHRDSARPQFGVMRGGRFDSEQMSPVQPAQWYLGTFVSANGRAETLPQRLERFATENPRAFEAEYVAVVRAWLDWRDGKLDAARDAIARLDQTLPAGSVAGETARELLRRIAAKETPGRELRFVAAR